MGKVLKMRRTKTLEELKIHYAEPGAEGEVWGSQWRPTARVCKHLSARPKGQGCPDDQTVKKGF
jgi:hypothetical protein